MKHPLIQLTLIAAIALTIPLSSCSDLKGPPPDEFAVPEEEKIEEETKKKVGYVLRDIPSPVKITSALASASEGYQSSLGNSPSKSSSYNSNYQKAVNLGVYLSDLCYAINYGEKAVVGSYLKAIVGMANGLGMEKAFDAEFATSIEDNIDNIDTLNKIIEAGLKRADDFFISNERVASGSFMITGGYIETLYLTLNVIGEQKKSENTQALYSTAQMLILAYENLLTLVKEYEGDSQYAELITQLEKLSEAYKATGEVNRLSLKKVQVLRTEVDAVRAAMVN